MEEKGSIKTLEEQKILLENIPIEIGQKGKSKTKGLFGHFKYSKAVPVRLGNYLLEIPSRSALKITVYRTEVYEKVAYFESADEVPWEHL
jgi:hypothetical protein